MKTFVGYGLEEKDVYSWVNHPVMGKVISSIQDGSWKEKFCFDKYVDIDAKFLGVKEEGFRISDFYSETFVVMLGTFGSFEDWQDFLNVRVAYILKYQTLYPFVKFSDELMAYILDNFDVKRIEYLLSPNLGLNFDFTVAHKGVVECCNVDKNIPLVCLKSKNLSFYAPQGGIFRLAFLEHGQKEHLKVWFEELIELVREDAQKYALNDEEEKVLLIRGDAMYDEYKKMFEFLD